MNCSKQQNCILIGVTILFLVSCIDPFFLEINQNNDLLAIDASIIKGREKQIVKISVSSSISNPEYLPLQNCFVVVTDNSGGEFIFQEESEGEYVVNIDDSELNYNTQYKLIVNTPSGEIYESNYQTLPETPPVDSFYYFREFHYSSSSNSETNEGFQFYVDINAPEHAPRYYKWQVWETWENRAQFEISGFYDGENFHFFDGLTDSLYYCWDNGQLDGLYSENTVNLIRNEKKEIPLYFLEKTDDEKLWIKYCVTVKQYALNEEAYRYWHQRESELYESDGIYTKQPFQINSNVINTNDPDEQVLGFFWVSSCTEEHIFFEDPFYASVYRPCWIGLMGPPPYYGRMPIYFVGSPPDLYTSNSKCLDCRRIGGIPVRPDFWE